MKKVLLIIVGLISQFALADKEVKRLENGYIQEKYYKYEGACYLVTDIYRRGTDMLEQKPITQEVVDSKECFASYKVKGNQCFAYDRFGKQTDAVEQRFCSPSQNYRNGWYIIAENLKGSLQLTIPTGNYRFQGGKEPSIEVAAQGDVTCKITLFENDSADRVLKPRILRLSDIQVQIAESMAYFSFNSLSEKAVDGSQLEPVRNVTCVVRDGFRLADGSKFDVKQAKSFSLQAVFEISKTIQFVVSKKPATDI